MKKLLFVLMALLPLTYISAQQSEYAYFRSLTAAAQEQVKAEKYTTIKGVSFVSDLYTFAALGSLHKGYSEGDHFTAGTGLGMNAGVEVWLLYIGIGLEWQPHWLKYENGFAGTYYSIPIYATVRTYLPVSTTFQPYWWADWGGTIACNDGRGGMTLRTGLAVDYKRLNIGIAFDMDTGKYMYMGGLLKIGVRFGKLTDGKTKLNGSRSATIL